MNDGRRVIPKIKAAPKIGQLYWCDFGTDVILPEMPKKRPIVVISHRNTLHGTCLVVPASTDPQEGSNAKWALELSVSPEPGRTTWVVCNHLYTVSTARLSPLGTKMGKVTDAEMQGILKLVFDWMPAPR